MIISVHAKGGVGKSLHVVHLLEQLKKDKNKKYYMIGNIEGYAFDETLALATEPKAKYKITEYIINTDWKKRAQELKETEGKQLVFVFDECQCFIRRGIIERQHKEQLYFFFEFARHYGCDIFLITQHWNKIDPEIQTLVHKLHQVSQASTPNSNRVRIINPDDFPEVEKTETYGPVNKYYDLYTSSYTEDGNQKPKSILLKYYKQAIALIIIFIISIYYSSTKIVDYTKSDTPEKIKSESSPDDKQENKDQKETVPAGNNSQKAIARLRKQWQHPIAPEMFDAINCYQVTKYTHTCPNIKKHKLFDRIFTNSYCKNNICDYTYFNKEKYDTDGNNKHCCLPDGKSLADISSNNQFDGFNEPQEQQSQESFQIFNK